MVSTLYQEKMVTKQEVEHLNEVVSPWGRLVKIQCTKSTDVVNGTAKLLAEVQCDKELKCLKGQESIFMIIMYVLHIMFKHASYCGG